MLKGRKQGLLHAFPGSVVAAGTVTLASNFFLSFVYYFILVCWLVFQDKV